MNAEFKAYLRNGSQELLEHLRSGLDRAAEVKSVADPSPAHALHDLAAEEDASLIVVGSTHTGRAGRVLPGSTAERLLHGSPCPVAVAPKGYTQRSGDQPGIIGCGFDGSQSAHHALRTAQRIAAATGARLRLIRAFKPVSSEVPLKGVPMGGISYNERLKVRASEELDATVAKLDAEPRAEKFFAVGDPAEILADASEQLELLLVGSRGYGPLHSVLVGGVAGRVVREAACPVLVLPRKARHVEEDSLFADATSRASAA
jgi:nucleotide-binding universal stress UspA family protein